MRWLALLTLLGCQPQPIPTVQGLFPDETDRARKFWPGCDPGPWQVLLVPNTPAWCDGQHALACARLNDQQVVLTWEHTNLIGHEIGHICSWTMLGNPDSEHALGTWTGFVPMVERGW